MGELVSLNSVIDTSTLGPGGSQGRPTMGSAFFWGVWGPLGSIVRRLAGELPPTLMRWSRDITEPQNLDAAILTTSA